MNDIVVINSALIGATVSPGDVVQYLYNTDFKTVKYAQERGSPQEAIDALNRMEFIGLHIRHYIAGHQKTLRRTLRDVRDFLRDYPKYARPLTLKAIEIIRYAFLSNEWYELMPKLEKATKRIEKLLQ